jgi:hypothetical protein
VTFSPDLIFDGYNIDLKGLRRGTLLVSADGLQFAGKFSGIKRGAPLIVYLQNWSEAPPSFAYWPRGASLIGSVVCIFDPSHFLDTRVVGGGFLGRSDRPAIDGLIKIIRALAKHLRVPANRVCFVGHSGGGFGALMAAIHWGNGRAVAINPQTSVAAFVGNAAAEPAIMAFSSELTAGQMIERYPLRTSVLHALRAAWIRGERPQLSIFHNRLDQFGYSNDYLPFCSALGIPSSGGSHISGTVRIAEFEDPHGHDTFPARSAGLQEINRLVSQPPWIWFLIRAAALYRRLAPFLNAERRSTE